MRLVSLSETTDRDGFIARFAQAQDELRHDPFRVGLLPAPVARGFLKMPLPFPAEFWLVQDGERTVGRIGANVSSLRWDGQATACAGFFECDPSRGDVAKALLDAAASWAASHGARRLLGPMNFNTWFPYRFKVKAAGTGGANANDDRQYAWEPVNPPEYPAFFESMGFRAIEHYHSVGTRSTRDIFEGTRAAFERAAGLGYTMRKFDSAHLLDREVPILHRISMAGFADNFLFEPIPEEFFRELYVPIANKVDVSLARFVLDPAGKEVGFCFAFADRADSGADQGQLVIKSIAVLPEARGRGLSNAFVHDCCREALTRGLDVFVSALMRSGAQSESYSRKGQEVWRHEYALFGKEIGT